MPWDRPFNRLNHIIFGATRHRAQAVTHNICRLMMAGIYRHMCGIFSVKNFSCQQRIASHGYLVCEFYFGAGAVIHAGFNVLYKRTSPPDIERLQAITNAEDRLTQIVSILKQQLVCSVARRVGWRGLGMRRSIELLRINVSLASRQQDCSARGDNPRNLFR